MYKYLALTRIVGCGEHDVRVPTARMQITGIIGHHFGDVRIGGSNAVRQWDIPTLAVYAYYRTRYRAPVNSRTVAVVFSFPDYGFSSHGFTFT
jgi:hypothetical protein